MLNDKLYSEMLQNFPFYLWYKKPKVFRNGKRIKVSFWFSHPKIMANFIKHKSLSFKRVIFLQRNYFLSSILIFVDFF